MKRRANQGMAIISALGFLVVIAVLVGAAMMMGVSTNRLSKDNARATQAQYAAEAGIEKAIFEAYTNVLAPTYTNTAYNTKNSSTWKPTLANYKTVLAATTLSSVTSTNKKLDVTEAKVTFTGTLSGGATYTATVKRTDKTVGVVDQIVLTVSSEGTYGGAVRVISQDVVVSSLKFNGDPYAVLSNNVNCIFCHTSVTSIEAAYDNSGNLLKVNSSAGLSNQANNERIRVATLESLNVDRSVDSVIAGTVYTKGTTNLPQQGGMLFANRPNATSTSTTVNPEALGNSLTGFDRADCSGSNQCPKGKNFYENYLASGGPDGDIPDKFPLPVTDTNNNRKIDDSEWAATIANDPNKGYIKGGSKQYMATSSFGVKGTLSNIGSNQLNSKDNASRGIAGNLVVSGDFEVQGTVYVDGDVVISGKMKGEGKIVARGNIYVVGDIKYDCGSSACNYGDPETLPTFAMVAGGNTLVGNYMTTATGDQGWTATYETCNTWGQDSSGKWVITGEERCRYNRWANPKGGWDNYGDRYFNSALTNTSSESPEYVDPGQYLPFIDPSKASLTTAEKNTLKSYFGGTIPAANSAERKSYARATVVYGDAKGTKNSNDWNGDSNGQNRTRASFTANEMAAFNQREYCKAVQNGTGCATQGLTNTYQAGYKPRFYTMRDGAPVYRCANYEASECRSYGDRSKDSNSTYYAGANFTQITDADVTALGGVKYSLSPTANWLATSGTDGRDSERALKQMWINNIENKSENEPLQIDGTMYSANAVFTIAPARSKIQGSITINGSLIAADLGVLAVGGDTNKWDPFQTNPNSDNDSQKNDKSGLRIHYDQRLNGLIGLRGNGQEGIVLTRGNFQQGKK
jgi:Tfp pilus assembly protein PilX